MAVASGRRFSSQRLGGKNTAVWKWPPRPQTEVSFEGLGACAVEMIVARKRGIEARFSRFRDA